MFIIIYFYFITKCAADVTFTKLKYIILKHQIYRVIYEYTSRYWIRETRVFGNVFLKYKYVRNTKYFLVSEDVNSFNF